MLWDKPTRTRITRERYEYRYLHLTSKRKRSLAPIQPLHRTNTRTSSFRPELINTLYDAQPNQCTTCGRRFPATPEGRTKKARHLDWHFRTNQRIASAVRQGQNRSWYIDEMEWIQLPNIDDSSAALDTSDPSSATNAGGAAAKAGKKNVRESYIPAPTGAAAVQNAACPICQEKFETVWHEEAQEWVWMDAVRVGGGAGRVYHASCHEEVAKASAGPAGFVLGQDRARSGTPDTVLGKRKAEVSFPPSTF